MNSNPKIVAMAEDAANQSVDNRTIARTLKASPKLDFLTN
jgi:hypothetical protein